MQRIQRSTPQRRTVKSEISLRKLPARLSSLKSIGSNPVLHYITQAVYACAICVDFHEPSRELCARRVGWKSFISWPKTGCIRELSTRRKENRSERAATAWISDVLVNHKWTVGAQFMSIKVSTWPKEHYPYLCSTIYRPPCSKLAQVPSLSHLIVALQFPLEPPWRLPRGACRCPCAEKVMNGHRIHRHLHNKQQLDRVSAQMLYIRIWGRSEFMRPEHKKGEWSPARARNTYWVLGPNLEPRFSRRFGWRVEG